LRSDTLIHWLASHPTRKASGVEASPVVSEDESVDPGEICAAFDHVFDLMSDER
jgi:hypothetical protein